MKLKDYFNELNLEEVEGFVQNKVPEDLYIDFKTANFPTDTNFDNKNLSKCLSGFANSSGGLIIWGIKASKNNKGMDVAKELRPIKEIMKFENYLKRIEGKSVVPIIDGIEYKRIENAEDEGFVIVFVPQSDRSPHMALYADKHYYKRSGDSFYLCEHFDIMDMINRRITPKLSIILINQRYYHRGTTPDNKTHFTFETILLIKNSGKAIAKFPSLKIFIKSPYKIAAFGIDGNGFRGLNLLPHRLDGLKYISGQDLVIHPGTILEVDKIEQNKILSKNQIEDLIVNYELVAENFPLSKGTIEIKQEDLCKEFEKL